VKSFEIPWIPNRLVWVAVWVSVLSAVLPAAAQPPDAASLYDARATWPETMLATRARYLAWGEADRAAGGPELGPWYVTPPLPLANFDEALYPEQGVDLLAKDESGQPRWVENSGYCDGQVHSLPLRDQAATYLFRTIRVDQEAALPVSLGSDDGIKVWLNGVGILSRDVPRSPAPDQDRLDLALKPGENAFLMKIVNKTGGHGFYFKLKEDPLPSVWAQIVGAFPREATWLAEDAPEGDPSGWFSAEGSPDFEKRVITAALGRIGQEGPLHQDFAALCEATTARTDPRWLSLHVRARICAEGMARIATLNIEALKRAVDDLEKSFPGYAEKAPAFRQRIAEAEAAAPALRARLEQGDEQALPEVEGLLSALREPLLSNPLLDFDEILLVKRRADQLGLPQNWQGNCAVPAFGYDNEIDAMNLASGELRTLYRPERNAFVGDVDLHFDASRMLFSMPGTHDRWQIWEIGADGSGLHQVTPGEEPDVNNYDACYLPNGRIVFDSTRCFQGIPCVGGGDAVANLFLLDPATQGIRQLCFDQDHNWCPTVLNNGRVMFSRWEYSDTPHYFSRLVFHMNPDGTNQMEYYGSNSFWPNSTFYARPIPNHPTQFIAIVSGHHGVPRMGELTLFDPALGRFEGDGIVQRIPGYGQKVEPVIMDQLVNDSWPRFLHPYPLSDKYFLVSCQRDPSAPWSLYLVDVFDNMTMLKEIPGYALFEPVPLRATTPPPIVPDKVRLDQDQATVYLADVYYGQGLAGVPRGSVKALRLYEFHYTYPQMGGHVNVAVEGGWDVHRILGTVPVCEDGSAFFKVPANTPIAVQPLDERGRALQLMRSWFAAMPGEVLSCVGCHERQNESAPLRKTLAARQAPSDIAPWYGPARGFSFKRDLQPVLCKHCVGCHDGSKEGRPDFSPKERNGWNNFTPAYLALHPYVRRPGPESDYHMQVPLEFFADTSELVQMIEKGHHGVKLDAEAWDRLITWIDLNVPDHGTWHEHRDIPADFHERRLAMRRQYANRPEDPEVIPELPPLDTAFVKPLETPRPEIAPPVCPDWPFDAGQAGQRQQAAGSEAQRMLDLGDDVTMQVALVPAGEFVMGEANGCLDEFPPGPVRIAQPFWMGVTEVTNAQYAQFDPLHRSGYLDQHNKDHTLRGYTAEEPEQPVIRITWDEARAFCAWLSERTGLDCRLPTEAEWEWACRAGAATPLAWGDLDTDFGLFANLADLSVKRLAVAGINPQPIANPGPFEDFLPKDARFDDGERLMCAVGKYQPNPWGLHDMHGNVAEWTLSAFRAYPYVDDDGRNALDNGERKAVRGGSWRDRPKRARSAFRLAYEPWRRVFDVGFRVVCAAPANTQVAHAEAP